MLLFKIMGFHNAIIMTKYMHFEFHLILTSIKVDGHSVSELFSFFFSKLHFTSFTFSVQK